MKTVLRVLVALPAILFVVMGVRWAVDPAGAAASLQMTLMEGAGLSSQIGDVGSFFLALGIMMLLGLVTARGSWFQAAALLLALAAVFRVLAWLVHGAAFTPDKIIVEVVLTAVLLLASARLAEGR